MTEDKKSGILSKALEATELMLNQWIMKARSDIASEEDDAVYRKSIYADPTNSTGAQGYQEKNTALSFNYQAQMAKKNTIVGAIIQTYQNKIAAHAKVSKDDFTTGFRIKRKNEEDAIEEIMKEMFRDSNSEQKSKNKEVKSEKNKDLAHSDVQEAEQSPEEAKADSNQDKQLSDREKRRAAKQELRKRTKKKIEALQEMIINCGSLEDRPFEARKWNFDAYLRAIVRDRLTYDQIATEIVPDEAQRVHYWVPVDGGTVRYASPSLSKYKDFDAQAAGYDLLYPEKEIKALEEQRDALTLDEEKLENNDYKYVQVVRGRIARAFTPDELCVGMANPTTDIYANGYSVSELEILTQIVAAHIFTENYNRSYFTQGFSAKGILHIKAALPRRKLETIRMQWNHMVKGNRNSFQTPIMSGMDEVKWIPLTQSHADMEFTKWMNYLIKIICSVFQIDPVEVGFGMKEEGGSSGGGLSGDNTKEKVEMSKSKGLKPMLTFLQNYINTNIVSKIDSDYELVFVGLDAESQKALSDREKEEVKFKKTINEIREDSGLEPIQGADDLLLDSVYFQWFSQFHPDGKKLVEDNRKKQKQDQEEARIQQQADAITMQNSQMAAQGDPMQKSLKVKPLKVEYYKIEEE